MEQRVLRRRAERLLTDIRSLEIHRATFTDVQNLRRKWRSLAHLEGNCAEGACTVEILWNDFYLRHVEFLSRLNVLHFFMLAGGCPEQIKARVIVEKGFVSGKGFHAAVGVTGHRAEGVWWDYPLMGDAYSLPSFAGSYQPPGTHSHYIVGKPGGCDGPCRRSSFHLRSVGGQRYYRSSHAVRFLVPDQMDSSVPHRRRHNAERVEAGRGGLWFGDQPITGLPIDIS
jgi:hypothetical protein